MKNKTILSMIYNIKHILYKYWKTKQYYITSDTRHINIENKTILNIRHSTDNILILINKTILNICDILILKNKTILNMIYKHIIY